MSERKEASGSSGLLVFLIGGALGAVAGLLFAPRSGRETREQIQQWMEDMGDKGKDLLDESRNLWEEGKETVQDKTDKLKQSVESAGRNISGRFTS